MIIKGGYQVEYGLMKERIKSKGIKTESNLRGQTQDILSRLDQDFLPPTLGPRYRKLPRRRDGGGQVP